MSNTYVFRLYVCAGSVSSQVAESRIKAMLEARLKGRYSLELIDIVHDPDKVDMDGILASPTLVKVHPPPERRIVGDLSDQDRVMAVLFNSTEADHSNA
ncbi:MAG: circadian clock KaiB family protein [Deltaproteobacteria bacterium]|nr:circadian clock KaiB family protein [Deltaproteobacteria bacterium]